jgi:hypothetical protein
METRAQLIDLPLAVGRGLERVLELAERADITIVD